MDDGQEIEVLPPARGSKAPLRFSEVTALPFIEKSLSEATRRSYRQAIAEFFRHAGMKHPTLVTPGDVTAWRDSLLGKKRKASTVALKLSVLRSFFEYLRATGLVPLNPASTRLVSPPELPEESAGRALTPKEVRILFSGPDRGKPEGARDYALMLTMLKLGLTTTVADRKWNNITIKSNGDRDESQSN